MKNENPLVIPELREMLAAGDSQTFRDFSESGHPAVICKRKYPYFRNAYRDFIQSWSLPNPEMSISPDCRVARHQAWNRNPPDRRVAP